MKSIFTFLLAVVAVGLLQAQTIQNSDFENWTTHQVFEEPQGFSTTNLYSFLIQQTANVTKETDAASGMYAAKLETTIVGNDTVFGLISNGNFVGDDLLGGIPYTGTPDSLSFSAKYEVKPMDTAVVMMIFKTAGVPIGIAYAQITGTQSAYTQKKFGIQWFSPLTIMPDSMLFAVVSSNPDAMAIDGSWLQIDDIALDGTLLPNGEFETWTQKGYEDVDMWHTFNLYSILYQPPYITKSNDAYSGSYALKLTTQIYNNGEDTIAHFSNGRFIEQEYMGGMRVNSNPAKVTGYYKYTPVGNDSALVAIRAYGFDNIGQYQNIENNLIKLGSAASYTYFEIPLYHNGWPMIDTLGIGFASSNIFDGDQYVMQGSELLIDSLNIVYQPISIQDAAASTTINVYPNPAKDIITFDIATMDSDAMIVVYDLSGKIIMQHKANKPQLNVSTLEQGLYIFTIVNNETSYKGKFTILR